MVSSLLVVIKNYKPLLLQDQRSDAKLLATTPVIASGLSFQAGLVQQVKKGLEKQSVGWLDFPRGYIAMKLGHPV